MGFPKDKSFVLSLLTLLCCCLRNVDRVAIASTLEKMKH